MRTRRSRATFGTMGLRTRQHLRGLAAPIALLAVLPLPATAEARIIGRAKASGDFAVAVASGSARRPRVLRVRVTARPRQRVSGSYTVVCSKGSGAGSKSGDFSGRTTLRRKLRMPMPRPDSCSVGASAQLEEGCRITLVLIAR